MLVKIITKLATLLREKFVKYVGEKSSRFMYLSFPMSLKQNMFLSPSTMMKLSLELGSSTTSRSVTASPRLNFQSEVTFLPTSSSSSEF